MNSTEFFSTNSTSAKIAAFLKYFEHEHARPARILQATIYEPLLQRNKKSLQSNDAVVGTKILQEFLISSRRIMTLTQYSVPLKKKRLDADRGKSYPTRIRTRHFSVLDCV